jgi:transposase
MEHLAIDLGGRESQICVRQNDGTILEERRCRTQALAAYLAGRPRSRVVVETCSEAFLIADAAVAAGHEVRVVPATLVRALGVGARGLKTDRRDARVLSEVSCRIDLPSVHVPSPLARQRKTLCGMRDGLVSARTKLINTVRGWLRTEGQRPRSGDATTFPARVRALWPEPPAACPSYVERQLQMIEQLSSAIAEADRELQTITRADALLRRLVTVPGVGPTTAVRFAAALDDIARFPDAHRVESYLGLVPGEDSSADRKRRTGITKAGPSSLRWCLVQAAWAARRMRRQDPLHRWARGIEQRRGTRIAIVALARKLAGILFAIWRDGGVYDPARGSIA